MSNPEIKKTLLGYCFLWSDEKVFIEVKHLKLTKDALKGEITVKSFLPSCNNHLHQANFNFSSTRSKVELCRFLSTQCDEVNWNALIEQLRIAVLEAYRFGEPLVLLDANDDVEEPEYLISPFILKNSFNLFYGSGGSGKTTFALLLCLMLKNPEIAKSINYNVNNPHEILYLDYESSQASIQRTYALLSRLYFPERTRLFYRKCSIPFIQDIEKIKEYIQDKKIDLIVIDSIGIACSAELNKDETANSFAMALRSLETTALCIGHTSKERTDKKTPFGTVFFLNNARNVFEIRRLYKPGEKELTIGLFHRKANFSELKRPCVFKFRYSEHAIEVEKHDSVREEDFMSEMPISEQIKHMLTKESMTIKQLSDLLNTSENVIKVILYRMKAKGVVVKIEQDKWALLYH